jgi:hypothetical protein
MINGKLINIIIIIIKPFSGYQKGHSHKIKYLDSFVKFPDESMDITVEKKFENLAIYARIQCTTISKK